MSTVIWSLIPNVSGSSLNSISVMPLGFAPYDGPTSDFSSGIDLKLHPYCLEVITMPKKKKSNELLEEQKAKEELEKYDIYTMNDATVERLLETEKNGEYTLIDDVDEFYDRFKK